MAADFPADEIKSFLPDAAPAIDTEKVTTLPLRDNAKGNSVSIYGD